MHRFGCSLGARAKAFKIAWISFATTKVLALTWTVWITIVRWNEAPTAFLVLMLVVTVAVSITQIYSTLVLRMLSARMTAQNEQEEINKTLRALQRQLSSVDQGVP